MLILKRITYFSIVIINFQLFLQNATSSIQFQNLINIIKSDYKTKDENNLQTITTDLGKIQGKQLLSRDGRNISGFLGVPYAKPPVNDLRFSVSEEIESWDGILNATKVRDQCLQIYKDGQANIPLGPVGSEDCLYINIYTPKKIKEGKLIEKNELFPVLVFIHGGFYGGNSSIYGHQYFMDEDVVLVMVNYRIFVLSNLNTEDGIASGNLGIKDQVLALKWIRKHIKNFGGDSKKVTIFGNSFGSMSVSAHVTSPMSAGLFQRAIMQSGNLLKSDIFTSHPRKNAFDLGTKLGCKNNITSVELLNCLRKIEGKNLTLAAKYMEFGFTVESDLLRALDTKIIPDDPVTLLKNGKFNKVPLLQGVVSSESLPSLLFAQRDFLHGRRIFKQKQDWDLFLEKNLNLKHVQNSSHAQLIEKISSFYFNTTYVSSIKDLRIEALINLFSDREHSYPQNFYADYEYTAFKNSLPIYLYYFSKTPEKSFFRKVLKEFGLKQTACHADELQFLFPTIYNVPKITKESPDYEFSKFLIKMWVNFAKFGDPNGITTDLNSKKSKNIWRPFSPNASENWYDLGDDLQMINPFGSRMNFWNSVDPNEIFY